MFWVERQAGLLRRLEHGERVNETIDWPNLIEEVEDLGRSELNAFEGLVLQALIHLLKIEAWPASAARRHWKAEAVVFLAGARRRFTPSMRQKIDLAALYRDALRVVRIDNDDSGVPAVLSETCGVTLDQLLAEDLPTLSRP